MLVYKNPFWIYARQTSKLQKALGRKRQFILKRKLVTEMIHYVMYPIVNKFYHVKTEVTDGNSVQSIKSEPTYFDLF